MQDIFKKIAKNAVENGKPTVFLFGEVTSAEPLVILVENRFEIQGADIVLMKEFRKGSYPTHRHTGFAGGPTTQPASGGSGESSFASHGHTLRSDYMTNAGEGSEQYYGLQTGDKVVLLRNAGGQSFLVLGRV